MYFNRTFLFYHNMKKIQQKLKNPVKSMACVVLKQILYPLSNIVSC